MLSPHCKTHILSSPDLNDDNLNLNALHNTIKEATFSLMQQRALPATIIITHFSENTPHYTQPGTKLPVFGADVTIERNISTFYPSMSKFHSISTISIKEAHYQ